MDPSIQEDVRSIPGLTQWVKDLVLLWLWCRLVTAALIQPLAWELPYAADAAPKKKENSELVFCMALFLKFPSSSNLFVLHFIKLLISIRMNIK